MASTKTPLFYRLLLPALFSIGSWFGFEAPGDEYGLWILGSIAGIWVTPFLEGDISGYRLPVLLAGMLTLFLVGWLMDRRRADLSRWSTCYVFGLLFFAALSFGSGPYELARNEDELWCGANLALYSSILLVAAWTYWTRLRRLLGYSDSGSPRP